MSELVAPRLSAPLCNTVAFAPDGKTLISGHWDGR